MIKDYRILAVIIAVATLAVVLSVRQAKHKEYAAYQKAYYEQLDVNDYEIKINQLNIRTADGVQIDRCMTCHIGAANQDAAHFELPIRTHPPIVPGQDKEPHDFKKIGCTVCHDGNGRGLTQRDAHGQFHLWTLPLKTGHLVQSSCSQCHLIDDTLAGAELLCRGKTLFIVKACWACHTVDGVSAGTKGPNLSNAGGKFQVHYLRTSLTDPKANIRSSKMPKFSWVQDPNTVEPLVIYLKSLRTHSLRSLSKGPVEEAQTGKAEDRDAADTKVSAERGQAIFHARDAGRIVRGGCINCHSYKDDNGTLVGNSIAPELTYAYRVRGPVYLRKHIQDPSADVIDTIMPTFSGLTDAELDSLVAFLATMTYDTTDRTSAALYANYCASCHGDDMNGQGRINQVNKLLDPLPRVFRHQFVVAYQDRLPNSIRTGVAGTAMPPWEKLLTDEEINTIVAYLKDRVTQGKKPFIRPDIALPAIGDIDSRTGQPIVAPDVEHGRKTFMENCTGCHGKLVNGKGVNAYDLEQPMPRNLINSKFMRQPSITPLRLYRSIKLGVPGTPMPPFDRVLTDQGILDAIAFLQSLNTDQKETSSQ